jgi:hypothetical protein
MQDRTGQQAVREASALSCAAMPGAWEGGSMLTEEILQHVDWATAEYWKSANMSLPSVVLLD